MKVSLNWVKQFLDFDLPEVDSLAATIGAQLGAIEKITDLGAKYKGIVIVKVIDCQPHPDADKLNICKVDDNKAVNNVERDEDGYVQIICGAPNVGAGMMAAWLPPGSVVPSSFDDNEPFTLSAKEIRGKLSNGMLASPKELALGDSHEGILELDVDLTSNKIDPNKNSLVDAIQNYAYVPSIKAGDDFSETYQLNDTIIDIENKMFTHRPDCFGILGVAREISGILGHQFTSPSVYASPKTTTDAADSSELVIINELPSLVPRFLVQVFDNIVIRPSPVWLQTYLVRSGIRPINNIVDITNFYMLLTGQPMHAYDYNKVQALSSGDKVNITIRNPRSGETISLINGKTVTPRSEAIMIATDQQLIGIGGVMGGSETEVDKTTTKIILECANFDMYSIRRTSMEHGLFTDAVTRFSKGQSPLQNDRVMAWSAGDIICYAEGLPGAMLDVNHLSEEVLKRGTLHPPIVIELSFINERLGLELDAQTIKGLLENVEFTTEIQNDSLSIKAPFWRTDIELREDVVEEIGRLYGYDKLPLVLPVRDIKPVSKDKLLSLKSTIRHQLAGAGANEVLSYSFVDGNLMDKVGQNKDKAFRVSNALSPDLQYYRLSLTPSLLEKVYPNLRAGYEQFAIFELGKVHNREALKDELPEEMERLALVYAAKDVQQVTGAPYYLALKYLNYLSDALKVELRLKPLTEHKNETDVMFETGRSALISIKGSEEVIGVLGEFVSSARRNLKLPPFIAGFELNYPKLVSHGFATSTYARLSRFPKLNQDITLRVDDSLSYQSLQDNLSKQLTDNKPENTSISLQLLDIFQKADDLSKKNVTFRVAITSYDRTLTDPEVNKLLETAALKLASDLGAVRL